MTTVPADADGQRPWLPVMDTLRRDILTGTIPPGAHLSCADIAARCGTTPRTVLTALSRLRQEDIVYFDRHTRYAAPAGTSTGATDARLGMELQRRRKEADLTIDQLAATSPVNQHTRGGYQAHRPDDIRAAETGRWYSRDFWEELDHALSADGTLLHAHDTLYATREPAADPNYYVPTGLVPADPVPIAVTITWSNGARTQVPLTLALGSCRARRLPGAAGRHRC